MLNVNNLITDNLDIWSSTVKKKKAVGRGSSKKIELHGVKKLRELILDLAVRGLLIPQDLCDETSDDVLERIEAKKLKLTNSGALKKGYSPDKILESEKPFELPVGWTFARFGSLLDFSGGSQPPKSTFSDEKREGYIQLIQIRDLGPKPHPVFVPLDSVSKFCTPEDVMIGRYGASVGKIFWGINGAYNVALIKLHNEYCSYFPKFLYLLMKSPLGQSLFTGISRSAQAGFKKEDIIHKLLPVLSEGEQKRIVAKVDELMALCDQLEQQQEDSISAHQTLVKTLLDALVDSASHSQTTEGKTKFEQAWERIAEHFDTLFTTEESINQLKQAILQLAVMGKLVSQNTNDERVNELLDRITSEKEKLIQEKKIKKQKALIKIDDSEKPFNLPSSWEWSRIGDASLVTEYGVSAKTFDTQDGIPVLKMGDIQSGKVVLGGQKKASSDYDGISELMLKTGDVLYNRTNSAELVGKTGLYEGPENTYSFASYLIRIQCGNTGVVPEFLNLNMNAPLFRKNQINPHLKQQCGQANVNGTIMKNMLIAVAPREEQKRIVKKVDELMTLCDTLKANLNKAQTTQLKMANSISDQALA